MSQVVKKKSWKPGQRARESETQLWGEIRRQVPVYEDVYNPLYVFKRDEPDGTQKLCHRHADQLELPG